MAARVSSRAFPYSVLPPPRSSMNFIRMRVPYTSLNASVFNRSLISSCCENWTVKRGSVKAFASKRRNRKVGARSKTKKKRELELNVDISVEAHLPEDPEILDIAEMLRLNAPVVMKLALDHLKDSEYKTRDSGVNNVDRFENVELSMLLCNDDFICKLNKEWRDEDHATDVLSMSQHIPELKLPTVRTHSIMGLLDFAPCFQVISVETAARQAEERGHPLLDETRILMVHGLLHLLGFDHEISDKAEEEMENEEELLLESLGWKGKGLIKSVYTAEINGSPHIGTPDGKKKALFNFPIQSLVISFAIWMARSAAISAMKKVDLSGKDGIVSEFSPGVFTQAFLYSLEHKVPLVAYSKDHCLTIFDHPLVDSLHTIYYEPKVEITPSVEDLLASVDVQKLLFLDTAEGVSTALRPYWSDATRGRASVVQALPDMLEIVPSGTSKGSGVRVLLDHLGITANEVMAIGDGENDVEMLELASLGIALSNGSDKAKAVANVIGLSNDEDGVADAIYRYAF
ncbi:hypothetical protein LguiB_011996 [Lonicera macranthoides]